MYFMCLFRMHTPEPNITLSISDIPESVFLHSLNSGQEAAATSESYNENDHSNSTNMAEELTSKESEATWKKSMEIKYSLSSGLELAKNQNDLEKKDKQMRRKENNVQPKSNNKKKSLKSNTISAKKKKSTLTSSLTGCRGSAKKKNEIDKGTTQSQKKKTSVCQKLGNTTKLLKLKKQQTEMDRSVKSSLTGTTGPAKKEDKINNKATGALQKKKGAPPESSHVMEPLKSKNPQIKPKVFTKIKPFLVGIAPSTRQKNKTQINNTQTHKKVYPTSSNMAEPLKLKNPQTKPNISTKINSFLSGAIGPTMPNNETKKKATETQRMKVYPEPRSATKPLKPKTTQTKPKMSTKIKSFLTGVIQPAKSKNNTKKKATQTQKKIHPKSSQMKEPLKSKNPQTKKKMPYKIKAFLTGTVRPTKQKNKLKKKAKEAQTKKKSVYSKFNLMAEPLKSRKTWTKPKMSTGPAKTKNEIKTTQRQQEKNNNHPKSSHKTQPMKSALPRTTLKKSTEMLYSTSGVGSASHKNETGRTTILNYLTFLKEDMKRIMGMFNHSDCGNDISSGNTVETC
ncbi:nucleolar protein dao-5-like [Protopterus annectens]|uniref:nucleolar protein dao-5-like n=1 Tax=Protopterus annectens TaxID=7888 RepID=UPI001CFAFFD2|nr:nucleolar protein dao-5-like [Protopterus annectens]XP_043914982.1 nucleolar protein dao-5-like [Protopterus annectens]